MWRLCYQLCAEVAQQFNSHVWIHMKSILFSNRSAPCGPTANVLHETRLFSLNRHIWYWWHCHQTFVRPFIMKAPGQYMGLRLVMVVVVKTAVGLTLSALCMQSLHVDCTCAGCCWLLLICWVVSRAQPFWSVLIMSEWLWKRIWLDHTFKTFTLNKAAFKYTMWWVFIKHRQPVIVNSNTTQ